MPRTVAIAPGPNMSGIASGTKAMSSSAWAGPVVVRGGGSLALDLVNVDAAGTPIEAPVDILVDGDRRIIPARAPLILKPGESLTLPPLQAHRFYGWPGTGTVLVGEVSEVNDDVTDNYFLEPFAAMAIVEDEPAYHPLWSDLHKG